MIRNRYLSQGLFLIIGRYSAAIFASIFWIISARLLTPDSLGKNFLLLTFIQFLTLLGLLGFNQGIHKYFSQQISRRGDIFIKGLFISTISLFIWCLILSYYLNSLMKEFSFCSIFFIMLIGGGGVSLWLISDSYYISQQKNEIVFVRHFIINFLRIITLLLLSLSLFSLVPIFAWIFPFILLSFWFIIVLKTLMNQNFHSGLVDITRDFFKYNLNEFIAILFDNLPGYVFPILIVILLNSAYVAYYSVPMSLFVLLIAISGSFAVVNLTQEGLELAKDKKNAFITWGIIICLGMGTFVFAPIPLTLYGEVYVQNSTNLLRLFGIMSIISAIQAQKVSNLQINNFRRSRLLLSILVSVSGLTLATIFFNITKEIEWMILGYMGGYTMGILIHNLFSHFFS